MSIFNKYDLVDVDESFPIPEMPDTGLILLVGASGTGKTTIAKKKFSYPDIEFDDRPIYQCFSTEENAERLLISCGLRTVPAWKRPYEQLSNGEKHRAYCAKALDMGSEVIDEFSSVVDRDTAKALAYSLQKHYRGSEIKRLCVATCHRDVIDWLNPDHIYDTDSKEWVSPLARGLLRRPSIKIHIESCGKEVWQVFKRHHYLSGKLNRSCNVFSASIDGKLVGMVSVLAFPNANMKNAWRGHRTVVLPEFQGLGIGSAISDSVAEYVVSQGCRYFSKTSHPAFGEHRERSPLWRPTSKNKKARADYSGAHITKEDKHKMLHKHRVCYSHEFVGRLSDDR